MLVPSQTFLAFAAYFCVLLSIGIISHKKNTSEEDFVIGGRGLNYWVTALSAHASDMSSWLFMGFPMVVFTRGLQEAWIAIGLFVGMFLCWQFLAPRIRLETAKYEACTLSSYLERRFNDGSGIIRIVSAVMTLLFMLHYLAAGLTSMGFIFEGVFGINYHLGISAAIAVIAIYTCYGGFVTVAWTDLFQALFLLAVLLIVPFTALSHVGGWNSVTTAAEAKNIPLQLLPSFTLDSLLPAFGLVLGWGLGYFGQPHIITKFMGIRHPEELRKSKYVGMTWQFLALSAATLCALVGIAFHSSTLDNPELVFVEMVRSLFTPFIAGFILCAILAATISTMDSQIIVSAGVISEDLYRIFSREKRPNEMLQKSRIAVIVVSCIAFLIACDKSKTVMEVVSYSWVGLGCSFGPVLLISLYYQNANRYGAIAGIVCGGLIAAFLPGLLPETVPTIYVMMPGFAAASLLIISVSALTNKTRHATL